MTYLKVFSDFRELMEPLSTEEKGRLFEAMLAYAMDGKQMALEGNERFIWPVARRTIDQEAAAYESKVEANRERGRKGAEVRWGKGTDGASIPKDGASIPEDSENSQEQEQEQKQEQYQEQAQEYVCVQEEEPAAGHTHIPAREDIAAYCRERKNGIDPDYFYSYYEANGWRVGQNPMRDWKAAVRAWERRDAQRGSGPGPIADTVQKVVEGARAARSARQRNTLLNYREEASHPSLESIAFSLDEL